MTQEFAFKLSIALTAFSTIFISCIRYKRTSKWQLYWYEVGELFASVFGGTSGIYVCFEVVSKYKEIEKLVNGGPPAMFMGGVASILLGFGQITKLALRRSR